MSIKSEVLAIAQEHGYEGSAQTITGAINALTDTLAGSDVQGGRTVASAIHALGPYIGGGGGGDFGNPVSISVTYDDGEGASTISPTFYVTAQEFVDTDSPVIASGVLANGKVAGGLYCTIYMDMSYYHAGSPVYYEGAETKQLEYTIVDYDYICFLVPEGASSVWFPFN